MFLFQYSLPRLPIPKLSDTCARYLESQRPLLTADEFESTKKITDEFRTHKDTDCMSLRLDAGFVSSVSCGAQDQLRVVSFLLSCSQHNNLTCAAPAQREMAPPHLCAVVSEDSSRIDTVSCCDFAVLEEWIRAYETHGHYESDRSYIEGEENTSCTTAMWKCLTVTLGRLCLFSDTGEIEESLKSSSIRLVQTKQTCFCLATGKVQCE